MSAAQGNKAMFIVISLLIVAAGFVIVFWNKIKPKADKAIKDIANATGGLTGLPAKKDFVPGDHVDSTVTNLKFRSSPAIKSDNVIGTFNSGGVTQATDSNGWVKVQRFSASLNPETGYVYSGYLKKSSTTDYGGGTVSNGGGAGGNW